MGLIQKIIGHILSIPARAKSVKFGRNSFLGPGYDIKPVLKGVILGDNVIVGRNAWLDISRYTKNARIIIGEGTQIGRSVMVSAAKEITIGKRCLISYNVSFLDHDHKFDSNLSPLESGITDAKKIIIEDDCFIGAHSFILKGVHLGKHCVVGANSVVAESFPDYSVIAGNPAKLIKNLAHPQ